MGMCRPILCSLILSLLLFSGEALAQVYSYSQGPGYVQEYYGNTVPYGAPVQNYNPPLQPMNPQYPGSALGPVPGTQQLAPQFSQQYRVYRPYGGYGTYNGYNNYPNGYGGYGAYPYSNTSKVGGANVRRTVDPVTGWQTTEIYRKKGRAGVQINQHPYYGRQTCFNTNRRKGSGFCL